MNAVTPETSEIAIRKRPRYQLWRARKDSIARWTISIGGTLVIGAIAMIFVYLLWVVWPLFTPASVESRVELGANNETAPAPAWLALDEQGEVVSGLSRTGVVHFRSANGGEMISSQPLATGELEVTATAFEAGKPGLVAVGTASGAVQVFEHQYAMDFSTGVETRRVVPSLEFPYGEDALLSLQAPVTHLAIADDSRALLLAAHGADGDLVLLRAAKTQNLLSGEVQIDIQTQSQGIPFGVTALALSGDRRWIYLGDASGNIHRFSSENLELQQTIAVSEHAISAVSMLLGGVSLLVGDESGALYQAFPVRDDQNQLSLQAIRSFPALQAEIVLIQPEQRRKGFVAVDSSGNVGLYHATTGEQVLDIDGQGPVAAVGLSPRANAILLAGEDGSIALYEVDNPHPDVSWATLWEKVWYENYPEPDYVWQSSAANTDFEPKFSLTPLVFGTLKAALYAMLFAVPLALMAAAYTACFMAPAVRELVKPIIEVMAALPTVVLGFLAGLWLAPFVEKHLAGVFMILLVLPPGIIAFAYLWSRHGGAFRKRVPAGWAPLLLVPVVVLLVALAMWFAEPVQAVLFGGDLRAWLTREAGIAYDQRNALVIGCAMGFAVIPTIFSIAEDAFYGVPRSLTMGSLALGATPWQTMTSVILPTASPGIFSALMIGLGRAVGETMIVLMATGNTPIMDWNLFEGMRTLAANIAVEMPESAVGSSHFRVLFLAALVLFLFTFVVNTGAEVIRQRLREKYSSL